MWKIDERVEFSSVIDETTARVEAVPYVVSRAIDRRAMSESTSSWDSEWSTDNVVEPHH